MVYRFFKKPFKPYGLGFSENLHKFKPFGHGSLGLRRPLWNLRKELEGAGFAGHGRTNDFEKAIPAAPVLLIELVEKEDETPMPSSGSQ